MTTTRKIYRLAFFATITILSISSCKKKGCTDLDAQNYSSEAEKDDGSCSFYETPLTYAFTDLAGNNTVSFSGQTERLNQLEELTTYMKSGTSTTISANSMRNMFYNIGDNGNGNFTFSSTKQLGNKCLFSDTSLFTGYMTVHAAASIDFASTAASGQAGVLTSGTSTYLFDANGIEHVQLIEKGLMGAVFMHQAANIYLSTANMNADNVAAVDSVQGKYYTNQEHYWDEAFGYFGAPVDYLTSIETFRFWAKYCDSRDTQLGSKQVMMNAFLKGRAAIINNDNTTRDAQILVITDMWERISAAQAISYLEGARDNFGTDNALFLHELSEAYAFIANLRYCPLVSRTIDITQIDAILDTTIGTNFWAVTTADLTYAINELNAIYNF
ncbi:MAG: hypothetical protein ACI857_001281 [Arenicella sp.]|jgi:hypothetical protein